jgi:ATPase subunit of ABC transporter with duplicated ATPase domains
VITATNLSKSFTGEPIFENINFSIGNNHKVALVGKNGCGKTTLFKIITGEYVPDTGQVVVEQEKIAYIPQEYSFPEELVGEYLEKKLDNAWDFYKVEKLVSQLEFKNFDPYQELKTLSEGQKMKVLILESLLLDPTFILIDEPTNHLDIEGIIWFEKFIKSLDKTVLMISHDRQFLNNTVDKIWEIDKKSLYEFVGNYDDYQEQKLKLIDRWDEEYTQFLKRKKQLEQLLENVRNIKDGKKRGKAVSSAKKRIAREVGGENEKVKYLSKRMDRVNFETGITHKKLMVRFDAVNKSYDAINVFENLSFDIRGGEKIWLFGPNGAGKSTIVKLIVGEEKPTEGTVKVGNNISIGYFAQKQTNLNYEQTLLENFQEETGTFHYDVYGQLKACLFDKDDLKKRIKDLSPGQRARYAFAIFAHKDYDMLILDEPDNHLDIETKEVLEKSLSEYNGTLLLVSHDRYFVENVGINRVLNLEKGILTTA